MIDLVQLQDDLTGVLLCYDALNTVQVKSYRRMRISQELDYRTLLTTPRNGKQGAGILVLMPEASGDSPNVAGPVLGWRVGIVTLEMDTVNMEAATGTLLSAEDLAQMVLDALHLESDEKIGTFQVVSDAVKEERDYVFPGCIGYRITLRLSAGKTTQTARVARVASSVGGGTCTLSTTTSGASIYYTTDGTFPGSSNSGAILYAAPFAVSSGDVIRAAAYKSGMNKSATVQIEV